MEWNARQRPPLADGATEAAGAGQWIAASELQRPRGKKVLNTTPGEKLCLRAAVIFRGVVVHCRGGGLGDAGAGLPSLCLWTAGAAAYSGEVNRG